MPLLALFARRTEPTPTPEPTPAPEPAPADPVAMQFRTRGGAVVALHQHTFTTRTDQHGTWTGRLRQVDGFNWRCLGCDTVGRDSSTDLAGYGTVSAARDHANGHAATCWSMPRPTA